MEQESSGQEEQGDEGLTFTDDLTREPTSQEGDDQFARPSVRPRSVTDPCCVRRERSERAQRRLAVPGQSELSLQHHPGVPGVSFQLGHRESHGLQRHHQDPQPALQRVSRDPGANVLKQTTESVP